jgi:hypothetical protein
MGHSVFIFICIKKMRGLLGVGVTKAENND